MTGGTPVIVEDGPTPFLPFAKGIPAIAPGPTSALTTVGDDGILLHYDGSLWMAVPTPLSEDVDLQGIWGRAGLH